VATVLVIFKLHLTKSGGGGSKA